MLDLSKHLMTNMHCEVPRLSMQHFSNCFVDKIFPPEPINNIFSSKKTCNAEELTMTTTTTKILFPVQPHSPETNTALILVVLVVADINKPTDFFFYCSMMYQI